MSLHEQCISHGAAEQCPGRQIESPGSGTDPWLGGSQQYEQPGKQLRVKTKVWGLTAGRETDDST